VISEQEVVMSQHTIRNVQDYTDAFLTSLGVLIFMALWGIAATFGYLWVVMSAYGLDQLFKWICRTRAY
jgi:hypothetical protein